MTRLRFFLLLFLWLPPAATAQDAPAGEAGASTPSEVQASPRTYLPLVLDPGLSMRSGSESLLSLQYGVAWAEDRLLGTRWFSEEGILGKTGGILGRFAKYFFLDQPVDYFTVVLAHEYFGHGARYRELGIDDVFYRFDRPPPYGPGGGEATINPGPGILSEHEVIAIWSAGLEVHPAINRHLNLRWMAKNEIHYREASVYFWSWQFMIDYVQSTDRDLANDVQDNDPRAYVRLLNRHAGYTEGDHLLMSVKVLQSRQLVNLANPFLLYALYTQLKTYLWDGKPSTTFPMLHIRGIDYLPSLRMGLTPFGPEYHLENYFRIRDKVALVDLRIGDQTFHESWGGVGLLIQNIYNSNPFSMDMNLEIWKQPEIEIGADPVVFKGGSFGGAFSLRGYYDFKGSRLPLSAIAELGYKSPGFIERHALDASPIIMLGIGLRH